MAAITTLLILIGTILISFIIAALPLHLTVKLFGGKTSILKSIFVNIISGIIIAIINSMFSSTASIVAFFAIIFVYREFFKLKWGKTIAVWAIQGTIIYIIYFLIGTLLLTLILAI